MADEVDNTIQTDDEWDIDELLKEFEPEVEEAEKKADDREAKNTKAIRKLAERQAKAEERERVEKLTGEFYAKASDEAKALADVLLAGVSDETKVKRMLDLADAKAKAMATDVEAEEAAEEADTEKSFAAPPQPYHQAPDDPWKPVIERVKAGDTHASFIEFMADEDGFPGTVQKRR